MTETKKDKKEVETLKKQIDELGNTAALMAYERLCDLCDGIHVEERTLGNNIRRYTKEPNGEACRYLMDRHLGRPSQEVKGPGTDGAFKVEVVNYGEGDSCGKEK